MALLKLTYPHAALSRLGKGLSDLLPGSTIRTVGRRQSARRLSEPKIYPAAYGHGKVTFLQSGVPPVPCATQVQGSRWGMLGAA